METVRCSAARVAVRSWRTYRREQKLRKEMHVHNGDWNDGMGNGYWWWIPMMILMIAFWGGLIWMGVTLVNRGRQHGNGDVTTPPSAPQKASAQEILAERLARGEIEPEEYRQRLDALRSTSIG